ncbi:MAG TPA: DNA polymerase IV [Tissierellaceae bacterium]|nr:DNA polymerase IV [Tissierellaceae bacterium]
MDKKIIFHIDVNSAYLSWEAAYRKQHGEAIDLREIPSVVGGDESKRHGIVLAKSILAKKYNIQTGESLYMARNKCPNLNIVPPNYLRYFKASNAMIQLLEEYTPEIQQYSIDEAFLKLDCKDEKEYIEKAYEINKRIKKELGFTVNIGLGENKLLAKMASELEKPDKVHTLFKRQLEEKMWALPVGDLFMVGSKTEKKLKSRGIFTIGDLANADKDYIYSWLKKPGMTIWEYANGIESSKIRTEVDVAQTISNSTTTSCDIEDRERALLILLGISEMLGIRIRDKKMCGRVISLSIRDNDFFSYSKQKKIAICTNSTNKIYSMATQLFDQIWKGKPLRQFSISISDLLSDDYQQLNLLEKHNLKEEIMDKAVDTIRNKHGYNAIKRSCFLNTGIDHIIGGVLKEEGKHMIVNKF